MDLVAHLGTFLAVVDQRNFTRAAEHLGIPQPLLSRRIKTLEENWNAELFDRSRRQIELTTFGEFVIPYARDIVQRVEHLQQIVLSSGKSAMTVIGVPPDCSPAALARIIRAADDRGIALAVHSAPEPARSIGFENGELAAALIRVPIASARLRVPIGIASVAALSEPPARFRHLDALRPVRGAEDVDPLTILILPEDDIELFINRLDQAVAQAGLPRGSVRVALSSSAAATEVLAERAFLLCDRLAARRHGLSWAPLGLTALDRGYELRIANSSRINLDSDSDPDWLMRLLGDAIGTDQRPPGARSDPHAHLTASA